MFLSLPIEFALALLANGLEFLLLPSAGGWVHLMVSGKARQVRFRNHYWLLSPYCPSLPPFYLWSSLIVMGFICPLKTWKAVTIKSPGLDVWREGQGMSLKRDLKLFNFLLDYIILLCISVFVAGVLVFYLFKWIFETVLLNHLLLKLASKETNAI